MFISCNRSQKKLKSSLDLQDEGIEVDGLDGTDVVVVENVVNKALSFDDDKDEMECKLAEIKKDADEKHNNLVNLLVK